MTLTKEKWTKMKMMTKKSFNNKMNRTKIFRLEMTKTSSTDKDKIKTIVETTVVTRKNTNRTETGRRNGKTSTSLRIRRNPKRTLKRR